MEKRELSYSVDGNVLFFFFSGPPLRHMEVPRLVVESELQPPAYTHSHTGSELHL